MRTIFRKLGTAALLASLAAWVSRAPVVYAQSGPTDYSYPISCGRPGGCVTLACDALSDWSTEWYYGYYYYKNGGNAIYTSGDIEGADVPEHYDCTYPVGQEKADSGDCSMNNDLFSATLNQNVYDMTWEKQCTIAFMAECPGGPSCSSAEQESASYEDCGQGAYLVISQ